MNILKSIILLLFCFCLIETTYSQSQVMLGWQDFDSPSNNFTILFVPNYPTNPNYGINQWLINNDYDGQGMYPNTPSQDSTVGGIGQISSPNSNYLHIRDVANPVYNDCYDPLSSSERWAVMPSGVCTHGYSAVVFNFWWVAQGSPGDYGEVYYSISGPGGPWILCAKLDPGPCGDDTKYCNTNKWKFARVENVGFVNQDNLSFAFKWTNDGTNTNDVIPFAIDDIIIIGEYDENNPTANITAEYMNPTIVCHEDVLNPVLQFWFTVSDSLCDGSYEIELSDSNCDFNNSVVLGGWNTGPPPQIPNYTPGLHGIQGTILIPSFIPPGDCYCFRINRTSPPLITGIADTGCFEIIDTCSESTEVADTPAVLQDPYYNPTNPANPIGLPADQQYICDYSVIDVKFFSYGAYNPGNNYILELSDSTGSFASPQTIGGPMPSTQTYDPAIYPPPISPGQISGSIPDSVDGKKLGESCDYYIRVVSTDPVGVAAVWGPFCIKDCDVKTNDGKDISVCITDGCNASTTKSVSVGITSPIDFNYTVTTSTNVISITSTDTIIWDREACAYVDSTIIDSVYEDEYTIDVTSSGSWGMGWKWMVNGEPQSPADSINPSFVFSCPGNYNVLLESLDPCVAPVEKEVVFGNMSSDFSYVVNGSEVSFTSNATSLPEHKATYSWSFGDGWTSGDKNPTHEYSSCFGSFTVTLTLVAENCCTTSHTEEVLAGDLVADFDVSVGGNIATFTDKSLGLEDTSSNGQSWVWDFGDGATKIIWGRTDTVYNASTCTLDESMLQHTIDDDGTVPPVTTIDTLAIGDTIIGDASHQYDACGIYEVSLTCVDSGGICIKVPYKMNSFDSTIFYEACNKFQVQILSPGPPLPPAMTIISTGELGWHLDTVSDTLELCVPSFTLYQAMGYQLGMYYMRIIATDANDIVVPFDTTNLLGSLIRFSVRGISGDVMDFDIIDQNGAIADTICANADGIGFLINSPVVPSSNYMVNFFYDNNLYATFLWNTSQYPLNQYNPLCCFNLSTWATGLYYVTFQEVEKAYVPFSTEEFCVGPLSGPQYFYIKGPPDVTINGPTIVCVGDTVTYTSNFMDTLRYCVDNSVVFDSVFVSGTYYSWDFIDNFNIGEIVEYANNQITIAWTDYGPASIELTALGTCGSGSSSTTIIVTPKSDLDFNNDTTICEGESITLTAINQAWMAYNDFAWIIECDTVREVSVTSDNDDELILTPDTEITVIVWVDNGGCPDWDTVTIKVVETPDLETIDVEICIGDTAQLNAFATEATSYSWSPFIGLDNDTINNPIAYPQTTTEYIVTVGYDSICPDIVDTATVTVNIPIVEAGTDTTIFLGDQVLLGATGGVTYVWTPEAGLDNPNVANPMATPDFTTTYVVTITDANGCVDIDSLTIEVISFQFEPEVPDAFTPDGSGPSSNDRLYVHDVLGREGDALETVNFKIFNRWGELIFEATEVSQIVYPNGGWDGTNMNNGKPMEVGVYVWLLEAQTVKEEKIGPISGNVTLLR
ncbi:MAG TPA: PKD domain-containing protein [Flavobacteriales bacterium]|nr:PKD domain-containing protein [Flavobacteriales bacterium]